MRFSIGYQLPSESDCLSDVVRDYREHVAEVYFALPGASSGRAPLGLADGWTEAEAGEVMAQELAEISRAGVRLVLLLNAACYGRRATSARMAREVRESIERAAARGDLCAVTTASPFVARAVQEDFPHLEVRASINMRVGTVEALEHLADRFDAFYLQRELNRRPERIARLREWCDGHGKGLHLLANSGCLRHCAFQSFHDNLVAHEAEALREENVPQRYPAPCWEYLARPEHRVAWLQATWIRPEDLHAYDRWFGVVKLATRMHANPRKVVAAYARGRFKGNLLDLMEPGYGPLLPGWILDNTRFPDDWFERVTTCGQDCPPCGYCRSVLDGALVPVPSSAACRQAAGPPVVP